MEDVLGELHKAREVFIEKATEQARHMAWVIAVIYSKVKYSSVSDFRRLWISTVGDWQKYASFLQRKLSEKKQQQTRKSSCVNARGILPAT